MNNKLLPIALMMSLGGAAHAAPFMTMDPRSMAMGGTGVAAADFHNAPLYNPAMLGAPSSTRWFALGIPATASVADPADLRTAVESFNNNQYLRKFDAAATDFNTKLSSVQASMPTPTAQQINDLIAAKTTLGISIANLNNGLKTFSDKPAALGATAAVTMATHGRHWGAAVVTDAWANIGFGAHYAQSDYDTLNAIVTNLNAWDGTSTGTLPSNVNFFSQTVASYVDIRGAAVAEAGVAFGKRQEVLDDEVYWGVTPKWQYIDTFDVHYASNALAQMTLTPEQLLRQNTRKYTTMNVDLGLGYIYDKVWRAGATIKNLVPGTYKTALGNKIVLNPALRIGGAYQTKRFTAAVDLDVTENMPAGIGEKSRHLAAGCELDVWVLQLRAGARTNLSNTRLSVFTAGLGLNLFLLHLDIGAAVGNNEWGMAAQAGMNF